VSRAASARPTKPAPPFPCSPLPLHVIRRSPRRHRPFRRHHPARRRPRAARERRRSNVTSRPGRSVRRMPRKTPRSRSSLTSVAATFPEREPFDPHPRDRLAASMASATLTAISARRVPHELRDHSLIPREVANGRGRRARLRESPRVDSLSFHGLRWHSPLLRDRMQGRWQLVFLVAINTGLQLLTASLVRHRMGSTGIEPISRRLRALRHRTHARRRQSLAILLCWCRQHPAVAATAGPCHVYGVYGVLRPWAQRLLAQVEKGDLLRGRSLACRALGRARPATPPRCSCLSPF
jgi:hypothetical protein